MKDLTEKLRGYVSLLQEKDEAESNKMSQDDYLQSKYPKPEIKKIVCLTPLQVKIIPVIALGLITIIGLIMIIIGAVNGNQKSGFIVFGIVGILAIGLGYKFLIYKVIDFFRIDIPLKREVEEINAKNQVYNESVYPKEIAEYEQLLPQWQKEYEESQKENDLKLEKVAADLAEFDGFLPDKYIDVADKILEILENYRAETLPEAINVYENDCAQAEIIEEQRKMREAAEREAEFARQRAAAEEKRLEEEENKRRQEIRDAKNVCKNCIYSTKCNKWGTPNCASYVPDKRRF